MGLNKHMELLNSVTERNRLYMIALHWIKILWRGVNKMMSGFGMLAGRIILWVNLYVQSNSIWQLYDRSDNYCCHIWSGSQTPNTTTLVYLQKKRKLSLQWVRWAPQGCQFTHPMTTELKNTLIQCLWLMLTKLWIILDRCQARKEGKNWHQDVGFRKLDCLYFSNFI